MDLKKGIKIMQHSPIIHEIKFYQQTLKLIHPVDEYKHFFYITITPIINDLGLNVKSQYDKLQNESKWESQIFTLNNHNRTLCIPLSKLDSWLSSVFSLTKFKDKMYRYQNELLGAIKIYYDEYLEIQKQNNIENAKKLAIKESENAKQNEPIIQTQYITENSGCGLSLEKICLLGVIFGDWSE
jgi:hypothetical protein